MKIVRSSGKGPTERLFHHMAQKEFSSEAEMKQYLNSLTGRSLDDLEDLEGKTPLDRAQFLIYDAWEEPTPKKRLALAKKALKLSPDCTDAYNLLAEESTSPSEAYELYAQGYEAGKRVLGENFFSENKGHFWGRHETRPLMRSLGGLAETSFKLGVPAQGFAHGYEMLDLNPGDNQGIRYLLMSRHGEQMEFEAMASLMKRYPNDCGAEWYFTRPLLTFQKEGDTLSSKEQLHFALNENPFVTDYLLERKPFLTDLPDRIELGGESEALCYGVDFLGVWKKVDGALAWLGRQEVIFGQKKVAAGQLKRNDPCVCGSGRKQKKCCGV
jgi:hypothetical protein